MSETVATPLVSVVVPFFGVEDYIGECLESLRTQVLTDLEVVLVDDGSRDGSALVAERYAAADPRFRVVRQENAGLGPARNTGAAHARGRYLMFVDSDDVLPARALSSLAASLERTGSDLAAGNAMRFTRARGSYPSWTHQDAFAQADERVTLAERPELARDRMVWNKLYRRSFWDARDLTFPAIRYEDYPVTLRAYLEAASVDVLTETVYYWRDRESGTSITQQSADVRNAAERYASAMLVLDVLDTHPQASAQVRDLVHTTFARVDLVSMAQTYAAAPDAARGELAGMLRTMAGRLVRVPDLPQTRVARCILDAARRGDLPLVDAVGRRRAGGSARRLARDVAATRSPRSAYRLAWAIVPSPRAVAPGQAKPLRSTLTGVEATPSGVSLRVSTTLRSQFTRAVTLSATLEGAADSRSVPVTVTGTGPGRVHSRIDLPTDVLTGLAGEAGESGEASRVVLHARTPGGVVRWSGVVTATSDDLVGPLTVGGRQLQLTCRDGLAVRAVGADEPVVRVRAVEGDRLLLDVRPAVSAVRVTGMTPSPDLTAALERAADDEAVTVIDVTALTDADIVDDPIVGRSVRPVLVARGDGDAPGSARATTPVFLAGDGASLAVANVATWHLTRDADGHAVLVRSAS